MHAPAHDLQSWTACPISFGPACASSSSAPPRASARPYRPQEFPALLALGIGFTDLCKRGAGMDHVALQAGVDIEGFIAKMRRYRPETMAFTSKRAASLFYGRPTGAIALGHQPSQDDFPVVFVLASPSGAASGAWTLQPWRALAEHVADS
jgi:TDG/mug DNA glycosylase family protein